MKGVNGAKGSILKIELRSGLLQEQSLSCSLSKMNAPFQLSYIAVHFGLELAPCLIFNAIKFIYLRSICLLFSGIVNKLGEIGII